MNQSDYRAVLAERIKASRRRTFKTVDAARQAAEISRGTWEKAEKGLPIKDFSLAAIESALRWPDGYAQSLLEGKDPDARGLGEVLGLSEEPRHRPPANGFDAYMATIEDRLDNLESRMAIMENPYFADRATAARYAEIRTEIQRRGREQLSAADRKALLDVEQAAVRAQQSREAISEVSPDDAADTDSA